MKIICSCNNLHHGGLTKNIKNKYFVQPEL